MKDIFKGKAYKDFQWLPYPLDNYGVGTAYSKSQDKFLCDTFPCLGMETAPNPASSSEYERWIKIINPTTNVTYSAIGSGPSAEFTNQQKKKLLLQALVPKILSVIGVEGDVNFDTQRDVTLQLAKGTLRNLYAKPYLTYVTSLTSNADTYGLLSAYQTRRLVVVTSDVVINEFVIKVDKTSQAGAGIKLKVGEQAKSDFAGSGLNFTVSKSGTTHYIIKGNSPFIVGIRPKRMPLESGVGTSSIPRNWNTWKPETITIPPQRLQ